VYLAYLYCLGYPYAENYQIWWRFDKVLTKTSWVIFVAHTILLLVRTWILNTTVDFDGVIAILAV